MTPTEILALLDAEQGCQARATIIAACRALAIPAVDDALRSEDGSCTQWLYVVRPALRLALENA